MRRHVADAAHHRGVTKRPPQDIVLDHPVLKRDDGRLRTDQRLDEFRRPFRVPQLHCHHQDVDDAERGRVVGRGDARHVDVALRLVLDGEAVLTERVQMFAARDEGDVVPGVGQAAAVKPADTAGAHERNFHQLSRHPRRFNDARSACVRANIRGWSSQGSLRMTAVGDSTRSWNPSL
jgi:hypothetical protein